MTFGFDGVIIEFLLVRDEGTVDLFLAFEGGNMSPIYVMIDSTATGNRIKELMDKNGVSVNDLREACGFERPQAIYKWLSGKSLPAMDNMVIVSRLLHTTIDDILVTNEDVFVLGESDPNFLFE